MTPSPELVADLGRLAPAIARAAGDLILARRLGVVTVAETKSTATDVVTEVDRESEDLIRGLILAARPDDSIKGEEGVDLVGTSGVEWIVDPIDGTVNYLYGIPAYAVSIAASWQGQVVAGAVFDPTRDEMFTATLSGGAELNGTPIRVSECATLGQALVATGFGYSATRRAAQAQTLAQVLPQIRDIRRGGSAAIDLCYVACGRVDAEYERGLNPWDYAAGLLIAHEAGALSSGLSGAAASSEFCLVAGPGIFAAFESLLESLDPRQG